MNYDELMKILDEKGIKRSEFSKLSGVTAQQLTNAKTANTHFSDATMKKINKYFKETFGRSYDIDEDYIKDFYESHKETISIYRLNNEAKAIAEAYINAPESIKEAVAKLLDVERISREA